MSSKTLLSAPLRTDYPSLGQRIVFRLKVTGLQLRLAWQNRCHQSIHRHSQALTLIDYPILATSKTPLWTSEAAQESRWIAGKIQNLRVALQDLNGIEIPKSGIFSFWAQIGQPTRRNGYVEGRELRQGCLIPSVGGGLCQLSNALYSIALETGFEILERHAHSQVIPGSLAEVGRDATVFWNYVDLRFRVPENTRIEAYLSATDLVVQVRSSQTPHPSPTSSSTKDAQVRSWVDATHHCDACNVSGCSRSTPQLRTKRMLRTAYLVDEYWPEFDHYIQAHRRDQDWLMLPLPGKNWKKANYAWNTQGFATVKSATWQTLQRSLASRHLPVQGKSRQEQLLRNTQRLAEQYVA
ncbi:MAG: VanW family protein [Acaryochloris sp. SU_5_25]|nr:VanW family protein [Acaryochloris sp. SU_5_25]